MDDAVKDMTHDEFVRYVTSLNREDAPGYDYSLHFPVYDKGRKMYIAASTDRCLSCGHLISIADEVYWSRVNGDSRYGYEPMHVECYPRHRRKMEVTSMLTSHKRWLEDQIEQAENLINEIKKQEEWE